MSPPSSPDARADAHDALRARAERAGLVRAALAALGCAGAMGLAFPVVSLNLEAISGSGAVIAGAAGMAALSTIIIAPFVPSLFQRLGPRVSVLTGALIAAVSYALFAVADAVWHWYVLRVTFGAGITVAFVASEVWINQLARPDRRSRLLGLYAASLAAGFGLGGALVSIVGVTGPAPMITGAVLCLLAAAPFIGPRPRLRRPSAGETGLRDLVSAARLAPVAILAALAFGAIETNAMSFLPVYAVRLGWGEAGAAALILGTAIGNIVLQAPIGALADRFGRRRILDACALTGVLAPLGFILAGANLHAAVGLTVLYGGVVVGMYAVGLSLLAERAPPGRLAQANAAFVTAYGLGSLFSPPVAGIAIDVWDPYGVVLALAAFAGLYLVGGRVIRPGKP